MEYWVPCLKICHIIFYDFFSDPYMSLWSMVTWNCKICLNGEGLEMKKIERPPNCNYGRPTDQRIRDESYVFKLCWSQNTDIQNHEARRLEWGDHKLKLFLRNFHFSEFIEKQLFFRTYHCNFVLKLVILRFTSSLTRNKEIFNNFRKC